MRGWLVNDRLTAIPGTRTLWHMLLEGFPELVDMTNGGYATLKEHVEKAAGSMMPDYIIRNASYFPPLDLPCSQIAFMQDIHTGPLRAMQIDVCQQASLIVWNTEYTKSKYPELSEARSMTIPVGTDFDLFSLQDRSECRAIWGIEEGSALFVGRADHVKGWDLFCDLVKSSPGPFVAVAGDGVYSHLPRTKTFSALSQKDLAQIMNCCSVGLCLSREETQHLAGIEMGACGLPLLVTDVGIYYGREDGIWGAHASEVIPDFPVKTDPDREGIRAYWMEQGLDEANCVARWKVAIDAA